MNQRQSGCLIGVLIFLAWVSVTLADTVPEEAQRYMARGMAAVEMAKAPKDYERAVREFEQAAKLAPNWPDIYFNLGSVQAKAGNYGEAMRHYKRYLELAPNAPDAAKVREEIYKLEYRAEEEMVRKEMRKERGRFSLEDGVIYDSQLGLEWAPSNGQVLNHYQAEGYARDLSLAGGGWRLPTRAELKSLYDKSKPGNVDPVFGVGDKWVWTSELYNEVPSMPGACGFYFYDGTERAGDRANSKRPDNRRALAVRSGKIVLDSKNASVPDNAIGGYLGTTLQEMTEELAKASGLNKAKGAFVLTVNKNSPAEQAGLKSGDIILSFDGKEINEMSVLPPMVAATPVGKTVDARIYRDGKEQTVKVKIGNRQSTVLDSEKASVPNLLTGAYKGVRNYENGDKYEGEFTNRQFNGKGTYTYANGDKYEGEFVDGKFTGKGTFTCSNGKQLTGNLENKVPLEFTIRCN
jgi:tetratricopeptide (TPR) repeat protein